MWRIIFKMLMARKGRYGWLLTELVVVSIAVWVLVDPLVVQTSIELQDKGFDEHRLYRMELKTYSENYPHFVEMDEAERHEAQLLMLRMVRSYPGVASATFQGNDGPFCSSTSINMFRCGDREAFVNSVAFVPCSDFFKTFRFSESGRGGNAGLDSMTFDDGCVVMSEETFPGRSVMGKLDTISNKTVAATTGLVRLHPDTPPEGVMFLPRTGMDVRAIVMRISDNIDEQKFLSDFTDWVKKRLKSGNFYVKEVQSYSDFMDDNSGKFKSYVQMRMVLGIFFLFCLFLGVSGTFWMQTSNRREEIGIMKSFGATSSVIVRTLIAEGVILATAAVAIGCFLYLQYAIKEGLYLPDGNMYKFLSGRYWYEHFASHFAVTSLVTWMIVVIVVCTGIYVPARRVSRITPTDALHEE